MISTALFTSNSDEWYTPQDLFNRLNEEFHFNLDPCATPESAKCETYFTKEDDGLQKKWGGTGSFAIHRIQTLLNGLRKHTGKHGKITRLLSC